MKKTGEGDKSPLFSFSGFWYNVMNTNYRFE